jgi:hypothetical protein
MDLYKVYRQGLSNKKRDKKKYDKKLIKNEI